ncbi:MAG: hypothetical protein KBC27_01285 [Rickettsiales bacterium]|nr:hypothetical protein [Rickettsiales bacterium]
MNIQKINKLIFILLAAFFVNACDISNQNIPLCSDNLIEEIVKANNVSDISKLWKKLKQDRYITEKDSDQKVRPKFVGMQFIVESVISSMLKSGLAEKVTVVIYSPLPPTPLRIQDDNITQLVALDIIRDPVRLETVSARAVSLKELLQNKGLLYATYQKTDNLDAIPGMREYIANTEKFNTLLDNPIDKINEEFIGASYLIQCSNGQEVFFSIKSTQANDTKKSQWGLHYGSPFEHKVSGYFSTIQEVYKEAGVNFGD